MSAAQRLWWVRLHVGLLADPTIMGWTPARRWLWVGCHLLAAQGNPLGSLTQSGGDPLTIAELARRLDVDWHTANDFTEAALTAGKFARDPHSGALCIADWEYTQRSKVGAEVERSLGDSSSTHRPTAGAGVGLIPTPLVNGTRARQSETESALETEEKSLQRGPGTRDGTGGRLPITLHEIEVLTGRLRGADQNTPRIVAGVLQKGGVSEHEFRQALEKLMRRQDVVNQAGWLVTALERTRKQNRQEAA